jgi:hypothetical protein
VRECTYEDAELENEADCEFAIVGPDAGPLDFGRINIVLDLGGEQEPIAGVADAEQCADLFQWYPVGSHRIALCPAACDLFHADAGGFLVRFGCYL